MIDLHAHILPGVDDGPPDLAAAVAQARAVAANGTEMLATTSHVDHGFDLDPLEFAARRCEVQAAIDADGIPLQLLRGGELALRRYPDLSDAELDAIALGDGRTILLEPPFSPAGTALEAAAYALQDRGFDVLLAHPERSPDFAARLEELVALADRGVRMQATASSLTGAFGETAQRLAVELFRRGVVHVIASDTHGADKRTPDVNRELDAAADVLPEVAAQRDYWIHQAPAAIVAGRAVPAPPPVA